MAKLSFVAQFFLFGMIGLLMEIIFTGSKNAMINGDKTFTGHTSLLMFPIYGLAVFLKIVKKFLKSLCLHRLQSFLLRGTTYAILIFMVEFCSGLMMKAVLKQVPWDYSNCRFSIMGLIRLDYFPVWFCAGMMFEFVHALLELNKKPGRRF